MIHPSTELRFVNSDVGYGVVATEFIPKGTITWALDRLDREFTSDEVVNYDGHYQKLLDKYTFRNNTGNYVLCWDNGRYINHSFRSNCLTTAYDFEIAIKDIHPGEELTDDYGYLNLPEPFRGIDEGSRRKFVYPDDLLKYHRQWDKKLMSAFKRITKVKQPLRWILSTSTWSTCSNISCGQEQMASILDNYYDPTRQ